ncbi:MAG: CPBP family intramembrane metalloprotease [Candidatus Colwellbacteria bacterium]|nr:CPBP family intramembrane metalloprotease [Candidatus Colwellbacteria bacterium]
MRTKIFNIFSLILLSATGIILIALQVKPYGWLVYGAGLLSLVFAERQFAKHLLLVYVAIALLGITAITTDISYRHMFEMGLALVLVLIIPLTIARKFYKDKALIPYTFHHGRRWFRSEILYIVITAILSYFLLPFYLLNTGAYLNWNVEPGLSNIIRLFIGTNALGIWDELFFVNTVLGILIRHIKFGWANLIQSVLFTSFLYELGFTGWGFILIFIFALTQGYIFMKTKSLLYIITIHLTLDLILFLALIEAHHPEWLSIFIT